MNSEDFFEKLINNEITREDFEALLEGLDDDEIRAQYDNYLESKFEQTLNEYFVEKSFEKDESGIFEIVENAEHQKSIVNPRKKPFPIAATLLILIGTVFSILFVISRFNAVDDTYQVRSDNSPQLLTKSTPNKRMFRMRLEDGSFIHLNAVSQISYPHEFATEKREVEILGEAYFDVERDVNRPFLIKVKDYSVQVLGTSFNIQAYENEEDFSVTVESGTVRVNLGVEAMEPIILTKDQKLVFSPETKKAKITNVNADEELSWREGVLRFNATPMVKVVKMLERWYGVHIEIDDDEIYNKTLTGVHENENLKSVIESLTYATGTKYLIKNNTILIKN